MFLLASSKIEQNKSPHGKTTTTVIVFLDEGGRIRGTTSIHERLTAHRLIRHVACQCILKSNCQLQYAFPLKRAGPSQLTAGVYAQNKQPRVQCAALVMYSKKTLSTALHQPAALFGLIVNSTSSRSSRLSDYNTQENVLSTSDVQKFVET